MKYFLTSPRSGSSDYEIKYLLTNKDMKIRKTGNHYIFKYPLRGQKKYHESIDRIQLFLTGNKGLDLAIEEIYLEQGHGE